MMAISIQEMDVQATAAWSPVGIASKYRCCRLAGRLNPSRSVAVLAPVEQLAQCQQDVMGRIPRMACVHLALLVHTKTSRAAGIPSASVVPLALSLILARMLVAASRRAAPESREPARVLAREFLRLATRAQWASTKRRQANGTARALTSHTVASGFSELVTQLLTQVLARPARLAPTKILRARGMPSAIHVQ